MESKEFSRQNTIVAKDQPQYTPLPAYVRANKQVITCWKMSLEEMEIFKETGEIWLSQMTFGDPLQPVRMMVDPRDVCFDKEHELPPGYANWTEVWQAIEHIAKDQPGCDILFEDKEKNYKESIWSVFIEVNAETEEGNRHYLKNNSEN